MNKKWSEFINENINYKLKKTTYMIRFEIENKINVGKNNFKISSDVFGNINLNIFFQKNNKENYDAISNAIYVASLGHEIEISANVFDNDINYDKLISSISHELKHVYDAVTDDDISSFLNTESVYDLKNYFRNNPYFEFINLIYLSLKHEMEARNHMIYDRLRWLKTYDEQQLKDEYKNTYIYKSLIMLKNFNHNYFIKQFNVNDLIKYTNIFILSFIKNNTSIKNINELYNFYKNYEELFHNIADDYLIKANDVIEELIIDKRPYMEKIHLSIFRDVVDNYYLVYRLKSILENFLK
jgi:hypothetical protein